MSTERAFGHHERLLDLIAAGWASQALHVAVELGIPDRLAGGPTSSAELARATGAHEASLHRLLRALVTIEICTERDDGTFALTELGGLLRKDAEGSLCSWTRWWGGQLWPLFGRLLDSVRTGQSARRLMAGTRGFEHLERDPASAALFNSALAELTRLAAHGVVESFDFGRFRCIADLGGGYGELLSAILTRWPEPRGLLFDLPHALEGARLHMQQAGLGQRCEIVAGDFFQAVPPGADAYVLKSIIHDWNDADSLRILDNCRRVMAEGGRLLLVEHVLPERLEPSDLHRAHARSDLLMLVAHAAQERTREQFSRLLNEAGFELVGVYASGFALSVLEALPR